MKTTYKQKFYLGIKTSRRNILLILRLFLVLLLLLTSFSIIFKYLMKFEGHNYSWITSIYWTFTNMSTLGAGDITFQSDAGRLFNILVLLSGLIFILVLAPFTLIKLFQSTERIHRDLPRQAKGHVILTSYNYVSQTLIKKLKRFGVPYVLITPDLKEAGAFTDEKIKVVAGDLDDPETYKKVQIHNAAGVALTGDDFSNTSIAFAIRQVDQKTQIISTANTSSAEEVLFSAGVNNVLKLDEMMGKSLAHRITAGDALAHVIGHFDKLRIAEATVAGTPLVNKTLKESELRDSIGVSVVGIWENGIFSLATADTLITNRSVLILAGSQEQIDMYNEYFCIYNVTTGPIIIVGGGRVGSAMGKVFEERELEYCIIEKNPKLASHFKYVIGDASDKQLLLDSGLMNSPAVAITTHDDGTNIFITTLVRKLRPDIQLISRATIERTTNILLKAGSDFVMSYASMGADSIFNLLKNENVLMVAEGVDIFKVEVPKTIAGKVIKESNIREKSGCSVIALLEGNNININPEPNTILTQNTFMVLIGTVEAENKFFEQFAKKTTK